MTTALIVFLFLLFTVIGAPLFLSIGVATLACLNWVSGSGLSFDSSVAVILEMFRITESPVLIAIPLFTLAGAIMTEGGMSTRLINIATAMTGWLPGGLGVAAIGACTLFAALSGSSAVTIIAIGGILYPALQNQGFSEKSSLGLITSCGAIGILAPPSLPLIIYGVVAKTDINKLFVAGMVPGALTVALFSVACLTMGKFKGMKSEPFSGWRLWKAVREGIWALILPVVLLGGIYAGYTTATEAAAIAVVYALFVEFVIYKEIPFQKLPHIIVETMVLVGSIIIILLLALAFTYFLTDEQVPVKATLWIKNYVTTPLGFLVAMNIMLLVVGCIMDIFSALVIVGPLVVPVALQFGVDPIHLGIIFTMNLEIGFVTPPFGINLFISSTFFRKSVVEVVGGSLPFILLLLFALGLVTYFPELSLWLVRTSGVK